MAYSGEKLKAQTPHAEAQKAEVVQKEDPLKIVGLSKEDAAQKLKEEIQVARKKRADILEQVGKLNKADRNYEKNKAELLRQYEAVNQPIRHILKNILGTILPSSVDDDIRDARKEFEESANKTTKPNFDSLKRKGEAMESSGSNPAHPDVVEELTGMVVVEAALDLNASAEKYQARIKKDAEIQRDRNATPFAVLASELKSMEAQNEEGFFDEQIAGLRLAVNGQVSAEEKPGGYLEAEAVKLNEWEAKINSLKTGPRSDLYNGLGEIALDVHNVLAAARTADQYADDAMNPLAGIKTYYLRDRLDRIYNSIPRDSELARIQEDRNFLAKQYKEGTSGLDLEGYARRIRGLRREQSMREMQITGEMMNGRQSFYESLPQNEGEWEEWVWEKISSIDNAGISPSMLVYFPDWTSLLYAMGPLAGKRPDLVATISSWRAGYEFTLQMDVAGSSADMMAVAPNMDADAFALLSSKTNQGDLIRHAVDWLEENADEFMMSTALGRKKIHAKIAKQIDEWVEANPDKFSGQNYKFGVTFEKIAYRYWKIMGLEAKNDKVFLGSKSPDRPNGDKWIIKDHDTGLPTDPGVSEAKDKQARRRHQERSPGKKVNPEKYDGYIGESKFWLRRLLNFMHGARVEQNLEFITEVYDKLDLGVRDFFTTYLLDKGDRGRLKNADGTGFTEGKSVKRITYQMLDPDKVDYDNLAWKYAVWMDAVNKASKTRDALIATSGILEKPSITDQDLKQLRDAFQNVTEKDETILVSIAEAYLDLHKNLHLDQSLGSKLNPVGFFKWITQSRDQYGPDNEKQFPHHFVPESRAEEITGLKMGSLNKLQIEAVINKMMNVGFISPHAAEMLKRRYLGINLPFSNGKDLKIEDPDTGKISWVRNYPDLEGVGPVRFFVGAMEDLGDMGKSGILGFIQGIILGFWNESKKLADNIMKDVGK